MKIASLICSWAGDDKNVCFFCVAFCVAVTNGHLGLAVGLKLIEKAHASTVEAEGVIIIFEFFFLWISCLLMTRFERRQFSELI